MRKWRAATFDGLFEKSQVKVVGLTDKADFLYGNCTDIVEESAKGVAMNQRGCFYGLHLRILLKDNLAVFRNLRDVGMRITNRHTGKAFVSSNLCKNIDATADVAQFHFHLPFLDEGLCLFVMMWFHAFETFQTFVGIGYYIAESYCMFVAHLATVGYSTSKGVFIHPAIKHQAYKLHFARHILFCRCHCKGYSGWLRDT